MLSNKLKIVVAYRGSLKAPGRETGACLARSLKKLGHEVFEYGIIYENEKQINNLPLPESDLLIYCECNDGKVQYTELRNYPSKRKAYWVFDIAMWPNEHIALIRHMGFDTVFCGNKDYIPLLKKTCPGTRIEFLPYALDETILYPMPEVQKTIDVGLIGSPYPGRIALMEQIKKTGVKTEMTNGIYMTEMVKKLNSFKIHLNYLVGGCRGLLNARVFETPGCGVLLLNEDEDGIRDFFQDGKNIVLYKTAEECLEKVKYLLSNPKELERISKAGLEHCLKNHTYTNRASKILETLNEKYRTTDENSEAYLSPKNRLKIFLMRATYKLGFKKTFGGIYDGQR